MIKPYYGNIENITEKNNHYRKVLFTGKYQQLVVMSIKPGEEIGSEVHKKIDQFIRVESGKGIIIVNSREYKVKDGDSVIIPAGARHNVKNIYKSNPLKLYTIYSPPEHKPGTVQKNKPKNEHSH